MGRRQGTQLGIAQGGQRSRGNGGDLRCVQASHGSSRQAGYVGTEGGDLRRGEGVNLGRRDVGQLGRRQGTQLGIAQGGQRGRGHGAERRRRDGG